VDFSFNQDQQMIAETAETFLASRSSSERVRAAMATERGFDETLWAEITEQMGWQLTHIPEAYDGLGLGYVELCILFEKMGKNLLCSPFFSTISLGANALMIAATDDQKAEGLSQIATGESRYSLAYADASRHWGCEAVSAQYTQLEGGAIELNGDYSYVVDGHTADKLVVAARKLGSSGSDGIGLFVIAADASGVSRQWTPTMDQTRKLAKVSLNKVVVDEFAVMQDIGAAGKHLDNILALASIALSAEQMGVADKSLKMTVDYITERKQFGRAVGSFQAVKHKAADMMTKAEAARSAVYYAACIADEFLAGSPLGDELLEAASIAKAYCCEAAFYNAGCAIQLHGGVGFTWEYDVHLYFKRAKAAQVSFGDTAWHKERLAKLVLEAL
jgi:alkylation response protein AidB-like acyl-CoA dehydrogenase